MKILLLDTACQRAVVAIADENSILAEIYLDELKKQEPEKLVELRYEKLMSYGVKF